ncbi:MAG: hypothetical protein MK086_00355 [Flavobacteriales bacterium]|nr:hypothetical protein [Flavobacteriales bacterium]
MKSFVLSTLIPLLLMSCGVHTSSEITEEVKAKIPTPDTLHFKISEANNVIFQTILDNKDTLDLFFDTGGTELVLTYDGIREQTTLLETNDSEDEEDDFAIFDEETYSLSLGNLTWDSLYIYPFPVGPEEAAGHFGWDLFEDKIVELDYDKGLMIVHSNLDRNLDDYSKLEIEYTHTLFSIHGSISQGESNFSNRYLFDTGFQRAVIMDKDLRAKSGFPIDLPVIKESRLKNSEGTEFVNQVVEVDKICFGDACASEVPVQLLGAPNPARFETHILGGELLKRFNTILDFQNDFVYLKPNSLMDLPYADAS